MSLPSYVGEAVSFSPEPRSIVSCLCSYRLSSVPQEAMKEADTDGSGGITFGELAALMHKLKKDPNSNSAFVRKIHKAPAQVRSRSRKRRRRRDTQPLSRAVFLLVCCVEGS